MRISPVGLSNARCLVACAMAAFAAAWCPQLPATALPPAEPAVEIPPSGASVPVPAEFALLCEVYVDEMAKTNPPLATELGIHAYDGQMKDMSQKAVDERIASLNGYLKRFQEMDPAKLNTYERVDRQLVLNDIQGRLHELQNVQMWRKDPDIYSSSITSAVYSLIKRDFAPLDERLKSVIEREKQVPAVLQAARENLHNPPRIYTEIALEQMPGSIDFFRKDLPAAFTGVKDQSLLDQFKSQNQKVVDQLTAYQRYLKQDLLPASHGEFALGPENYRKKLLYEEMVDEPVDKLLADGYAELHKLQKEFVETARQVDPTHPAMEVLQAVAKDHPSPDKLISSTDGVLEDIRKFCLEHQIITIPSEDRVKVAQTPPFMRALTFASMDTPGPFEKKARESYYYVTLPEPGWDAAKTEEHMRAFSRLDLLNTSVHEAYPGHFVQFLWDRQLPTKIRQVTGCASNVEGWAHYCEQMMLDEGFGGGDKKLRLVQLHDALLRNCRYIVGIQMHTRGMSLADAIKFMEKEGYQEHANAERESKRGTSDPTYLVYTLGKLQILKLRDDYKKAHPRDFNLKDFHDQFMAQGAPPIKLVRAVMLHEAIPGEAVKAGLR